MHERDTATEKEFDTVLQTTLTTRPNSEIQAKYYKWLAKITNISKYV